MQIQITNELSQEIKDITFAAGGGSNSELVKTILLLAHPVGSYYWSSTNTNPHNLFGGTWIQVKDKFVIAVGDSHEVGKNYGSNIKNLSHSHTTGNHTLTIAETPAHFHYFQYSTASKQYSATVNGETNNHDFSNLTDEGHSIMAHWCMNGSERAGLTNTVGGSGAHNHGDTGSSLSTAFDITPACEAAYCWKRTA